MVLKGTCFKFWAFVCRIFWSRFHFQVVRVFELSNAAHTAACVPIVFRSLVSASHKVREFRMLCSHVGACVHTQHILEPVFALSIS